MDFVTLTVAAAGPVGRLTLNRPEKLNPLSTATLVEIANAARWFDERPAVKVVVIAGGGRAFTAGADLSGFSTPSDGAAAPALRRDGPDAGRAMADAVEAMRAVTVARIQGYCVGGGVVLASACDLRVAAEDAVFVIPEIDLGIPLAWGGVPRLIREIGPAMTKELVMTGRRFTAGEAKQIGFLNRVVPTDELDAEVDTLVAQLVEKSALTLMITKRHVDGITSAMVQLARSYQDADGFVSALFDDESRAVAARYFAAFQGRRAADGGGPPP